MSNAVTAFMVGDSGCGKTTLLFRYLNDTFPETDQPISPLESETLMLNMNGHKIALTVNDVAGREPFGGLRQLSYAKADVMVVCYSIEDRQSMENVNEIWKPEVVQYAPPGIPILLVGTKLEERDTGFYDNDDEMDEETLSTEAGEEMRKNISAVDFLECSAKTGENVREVFERAAEAGLEFHNANRRTSCILS